MVYGVMDINDLCIANGNINVLGFENDFWNAYDKRHVPQYAISL